MSDVRLSAAEVDHLLSPAAIRERAQALFVYTEEGKGAFRFHEAAFTPTVEYVLKVIHGNYPKGDIPFHSRWGHFRAGQIDRAAKLKQLCVPMDPLERARTQLDLVITSVLLDAGAGPRWSYYEKASGRSFARSEGLGVASFDMFMAGAMSSTGTSLRADAARLRRLTSDDIRRYFQVRPENPLLGVEGRLALLNGLAHALDNSKMFKDGRPGNILDYLSEKHGPRLRATQILRAVLDGFGPIWPGRLSSGGINLGDVWRHAGTGLLVPLHKLSQWMTYSLIEPMLEAGLEVGGVEELTGLAEYRNGGLFIDSGLLEVKDPAVREKAWRPDSDLIIEWRALTVHLLDRIGARIQSRLGKTPQEFPLAKVLEGGTWWAGRCLAKEKRPGGEPPLTIESDGTVF